MSWPSTKARRVLRALKRIGWTEKRNAKGSHVLLERSGWDDCAWAFAPGDELGPKILAKIGRKTGLTPGDL